MQVFFTNWLVIPLKQTKKPSNPSSFVSLVTRTRILSWGLLKYCVELQNSVVSVELTGFFLLRLTKFHVHLLWDSFKGPTEEASDMSVSLLEVPSTRTPANSFAFRGHLIIILYSFTVLLNTGVLGYHGKREWFFIIIRLRFWFNLTTLLTTALLLRFFFLRLIGAVMSNISERDNRKH